LSKENIVQSFWQNATNHGEKPAIMRKVSGTYVNVIWREHGKVVQLAAAGLLKLGIKRGEMVAVISQTRAEWTWADMAILSCAAISVPVYPTLTGAEASYILNNSDAVAVFVENAALLDRLLSAPNFPSKLRFAVLIEGSVNIKDERLQVVGWEDLLKDGEVYLPFHPDLLQERIDSIEPKDLCTIVYTSGTTGIPKGVMLLHENIYSICKAMDATAEFRDDDLELSFLPLAHVYERVGGQFFAIYRRITVAYAEALEKVPQNMVEVKPTFIIGVPRFYEKAYNRIQSEIRKLAKPQQYLIRWALALGRRAQRYEQAEMASSAGSEVDHAEKGIARTIYRAELRVADRIVFSKIRNRFGGRLRIMVSGAAPLSDEVHTFFDTIGLTVLEGYGLSETAAPATCNLLGESRTGTVGKPLPGVQIKIAEDGEVMVKGPGVFAGYYKNQEATNEAFRDGWFLTGDIGELDRDGYLRITDRKKDLIITAGGKHVAPQRIENLFRAESLISQVLVYGDRRKFISALITLNEVEVYALARSRGIAVKDYLELIKHPAILAAVDAIVAAKNSELANFEMVKKFKILENDFTIENNELTPTMKVRRKIVTERYKEILDSFYDVEDVALESIAR
jgi:long-chain acyl-CoA synthetase